jgi:bla regulator protein BlaR1
MTGLLLHTLVWTGVLIAAVLLLRRPVTRAFGPEAAYALWALPLARLVLPPVTLPAWMAPQAAAPEPAPRVVPPSDGPAEVIVWEAAADAPVEAASPAGFDLLAALSDLPIVEVLLLVWLAGAAVTLWRRFTAYFALRDALLADAREVGRAPALLGKVRLVETPATTAPLAMGVVDPVVALPPGFMALHDRAARDLALAHELAHHRGLDLLVNIIVQPLFALHWFNPLGRYGWLALRRDQEAACDARVMAQRSPQERAAYAALIARFATAPGATHNAALTAPMACPVLGEKSIIHRLRSLAMSDLSPRRRMAGRALLGAGLLALPLTASISYAASESVPKVPEVPELPAPPAPPAAPPAPDAPLPPEAPEAPEAPEPLTAFLFTGDEEGGEGESKVIVSERTLRGDDGKVRTVRVVRRPGPDGDALKSLDVDVRAMNRMSNAEHEQMRVALREALAEADRELADMPRAIAMAMAEAETAGAAARANAPKVIVMNNCDRAGTEPTEMVTGTDDKQTILICKSRVMASARRGLEEARAEIARDKDIPEDTRKELLKTLDSQIARWKEREG